MRRVVTIILPVYNVDKYLRICLDSVINQSYRDLEIILVDDGSVDKSGVICDEYAVLDSRIKVIHKQNGGVSAARNAGIESSTGEYICFADSDDILMSDYVAYLLSLLESQQTDVAVTTSMFSTFGGRQVVKDCIKVISGEDAAAAILYYHIPIGCYCKMFRRSFLLSQNIRFIPSVFIGEGFNFNVEAFCRAEKVAVGRRKIYCYRRDNMNSAMTKFNIEKSEMAVKAIDIIRDNLPAKSEKLSAACDFAEWHTKGDMFNWMVLADVKDEYSDFFNSCLMSVKQYAGKALAAPLNKKERLRAVIQFLNPFLFASLLRLRRRLLKR